MDATEVFDEESTRLLLAGNDFEIEQGLTAIHQHLQKHLCAWLRRRFPGLSPEDLANTWGEVLLNILQAARAGRFDGSRPLFPWLCAICDARATDHLRRQTTQKTTLTAAAEIMRRSRGSNDCPVLNELERNELMQLIPEAIEVLPRQQRLVFQAFVDHYPETRSMEVLQLLVSQRTGCPETLSEVKRALQEGRNKVRAFLRKRGYALGKEVNHE